ncbi:MAG: hypothetical protein Q7R41_12640 [Phycisphaerales bacterium]|nr:hypothetical protein [Phycisphaerales bacterium]
MADTHEYFTDREFGTQPPTHHEITKTTWGGLTTLVQRSISKGDFGNAFHDGCPDSPSTCCGTDDRAFVRTLRAEVPSWADWDALPDVATACDFLEFCHRYIALASAHSHHGFYGHDHLKFDIAGGRAKFRGEVNFLLQRNGITLHMSDDGLMERILDDPTGESVRRALFQTGDSSLDQLLEEARTKFKSPSPRIRQEALERTWDAWERLKTVKDADKKRGSALLLDACTSEPLMRSALEEEAKALTAIGNGFRIRHSETNKPEIVDAEHVDFVFQRMFAMLLLILRKNGMLA